METVFHCIIGELDTFTKTNANIYIQLIYLNELLSKNVKTKKYKLELKFIRPLF